MSHLETLENWRLLPKVVTVALWLDQVENGALVRVKNKVCLFVRYHIPNTNKVRFLKDVHMIKKLFLVLKCKPEGGGASGVLKSSSWSFKRFFEWLTRLVRVVFSDDLCG